MPREHLTDPKVNNLTAVPLVEDSPLLESIEPLRVIFQMPESPPGAVLPEDKVVSIGTEVVIDGTRSTGVGLSYRWSFDVFPVHSNTRIDNPTASVIRLTPDVPGLYLVKLVVRDSNNNSRPSYLAVRATLSNSLPSFGIYYRVQANGFPKPVQFTLQNPVDSDGEILFVEMEYGDGNRAVFNRREAEGLRYLIDHVYLASGVYNVKVALIDNKGGRTEKSLNVDLSQDNQIPVLKYTVNSTSGVAPFYFAHRCQHFL